MRSYLRFAAKGKLLYSIRMFVFVDESGDAGMKLGQGASELMTIVLVLFANEDHVAAVDQRITDLRRELRKPENFEFHFTSNSDQIREAFLKGVAPFSFTYTGMVIDKTRLYAEGYDYGGFY